MAKPKLALIPAAQGSKLFSVLPSSGVGDFDFSRSGTATRINSQGLIEEVSNGQSRLNYPMIDGKVVGCPHHILEPARTNLVTYSEDFSQSAWSKLNTTITPNSLISPDGSLNASKLVENSSNTSHYLQKTISTTSGIDYTFSIFVKKSERSIIRMSRAGGSTAASFDVNNLSILNSGSGEGKIESFKNDWVKCSFTFPTNVVSTSLRIELQTSQNATIQAYTGDGTSGVYIYGAQLEQGSYPTSYIKSNSGSTTTRSAETANGSGDAATFNDSEGVLMAEISALADDNDNWSSLSIGSNNTNNISIGFTDARNTIYAYKTNISSSWLPQIEVNSITNFNKIALSYGASENKFWINGFKLATNNTIGVNPNSLTNMQFNAASGGEKMYSNTKQLQYFDTALTDSELEQLTSWTSFSDMAEGQLYTIE